MALINLWDMLALDRELFTDITIDDRLDETVLINTILRKCGKLMPYETNPPLFKFFLHNWFDVKSYTISKLIDTMYFDYNPIDNYNRISQSDRSNTGRTESTMTSDTSDVTTAHATEYDTDNSVSNVTNSTTDSASGTTSLEKTVSAFDTNGYSPRDLETGSSSSNGNTSGESEVDFTRNTSSTKDNTQRVTGNEINDGEIDTTENESINTTSRGNIGVTTTQSMINQERDISLFSIYDWIATNLEIELFVGNYTW